MRLGMGLGMRLGMKLGMRLGMKLGMRLRCSAVNLYAKVKPVNCLPITVS